MAAKAQAPAPPARLGWRAPSQKGRIVRQVPKAQEVRLQEGPKDIQLVARRARGGNVFPFKPSGGTAGCGPRPEFSAGPRCAVLQVAAVRTHQEKSCRAPEPEPEWQLRTTVPKSPRIPAEASDAGAGAARAASEADKMEEVRDERFSQLRNEAPIP